MSLSVIIPVHNSEDYLKECVESVLQGLNEEDEIILVENGSSDSSWEICRSYNDTYPCVKAVQLETAGVSRARNYGIALAKGDWIIFLDSDDILDHGLIPAAHELDIDADIILCDYRFLDEDSAEYQNNLSDIRIVNPDMLRRAVLQYAKYRTQIKQAANLDNVTIWSCCSKLIRREFLTRNQILFPESLYLSEDTAFSLQLYCCAEKVCYIRQNAFFYRRTPSSASRIHHPKLLENNQYLRKWTYEYVVDKGLDEELKDELSSFLARKFTDECLYLIYSDTDKSFGIQYIRRNAAEPFMAQALKNAGYRYLIAGKRNCLKHWPVLWALKRKLYRPLFIFRFVSRQIW